MDAAGRAAQLLATLDAAVRDSGVIPPGSRVAVAVSGGADSVALYRALHASEHALGIEVLGLVHVNHQLRGAASEDDERFCRELAGATGRPIHVERVVVVRGKGPDRRSPEEAAREARYAALERGRSALEAELVALAHTRDDQAETVLLRLLRGAGPDGLQGIPPSRGVFVRPLLEVSRHTLRDYLDSIGQVWVEDGSNAELSVPRNWVRQRVLPTIEQAFPAATAALARHAVVSRGEAEWLAELSNHALRRHVHTEGGALVIDETLAEEPLGLARRVLLAVLRSTGVRQPGFDEVESLRALLDASSGGRELPGGLTANRIGGGVVLTRRGGHHARPSAYRYPLQVPGAVLVPEAAVEVEALGRAQAVAAPAGALEVLVDGEALGGSLVVRNWVAGDLIRPVGLSGRKKLQDVFVDAKVPRVERHRMALVADEHDRVVWVPGLAVDRRLRVTSRTKAVVVLRLTRQQALPVGGPE